MPQPRFSFVWYVEKWLGFLNSLDSERIEQKLLIYNMTMLIVLTGLFRAHEICHLDIFI